METRRAGLWQCLRLLFGLVISGLTPSAAAAPFCNDSTLLETGHALEITADCSVSGQALIEWSSQSLDMVKRIQLEYGCDMDMYNPAAEVQIAQHWTSHVGSGSVNISVPDDALCVIHGCYSVDGVYAGFYPVTPVNCSRAIPSTYTSTTDVGSAISTSTIYPLPSTTLPGSMESVHATLLLPNIIPPRDTLSPTSAMKDVGSAISTSAIFPFPTTTQGPGETLPPTSTIEASTTDVDSAISTSAILHLPSNTLPGSTEGNIAVTYIIIIPTTVFGVLVLLLLLCIIILVAVKRHRQNKRKDRWIPDQVVNTDLEIVSPDPRRFSRTSEETVYESLVKNDGYILNLSDPQQENHFSFMDGEIGSDKCSNELSFPVPERAPDNTTESIATQQNTYGSIVDDTRSKSQTVEVTDDSETHTTSQCPQILYTQIELPQPSPMPPVIHNPIICIPIQLTSTGDGYCRVATNNTVNNSGHCEYQSMQQDSTQFYVSEM